LRDIGGHCRTSPLLAAISFCSVAGLAATAFGLAQPYLSKLLIDGALLRRDYHVLLVVSGAMAAITVIGFVLNIASSYQYVRVSAQVPVRYARHALPSFADAVAAILGARQAGRRRIAYQ
jgi:ABC-type bacteriocin/lantibiotic exporter with double-glycine peptidase domain